MGEFAGFLVPAALAIIMLSLGLGLTVADFVRVVSRPKAFALGFFAQMVAVPVAAYGVATFFALPPEMALGLMILAICPGGVTSNILTKYASSDVALSISLTGVISLVSVFTVPFLVALLADHYLGIEAGGIDITTLGISMLNICVVPVMIGMVVRHYAPGLSTRIDPALSWLAFMMFIMVVAGAVVGNWTEFLDSISTLGPALVALCVALVWIGFGLARLFSLDRGETMAIAIETGIQNTAFGVTIGALIAERASNLPALGLPSAVYGLVMYAVVIPFVIWRRSA